MIRKLTADDVRKIREIHDWKMAEQKRLDETASAEALAEKFGVHVRTVEKVLNYSTWRHVL